MKKIKGFLSITLIFVMLVSSVSAYGMYDMATEEFIDDIFRFDVGEALGDDTVTAEDADTRRMEFLYSIGVWDDPEKSKDTLLTMAELGIIMSKIKLGSENAIADVYKKNDDKSLADYKTVYECLLTATGYYYRCAEFGNTAEAVLIVAADIGLISQKPENINAYITRGEFAKLVARAITLDICVMEYTSTGGYKYTVAPGKNILNTVHSIYDVGGFVNAIPGLAVYGGVSLREGFVQIERTNINAAGMDVIKYFGTCVNAYALFDDVTKQYNLVYIAPTQNSNMLEIDFKDIVDIKGNEITYVDDNAKELEVSVDGFVNIVENGKKLENLSEMSDFKVSEGKIVLLSSAEKSDFDTAVIYKYDYFVTDYVDTYQKMIGIKYGMKYKGNSYIPINEAAINRIIVDGEETDYTSINANQAIRVFSCETTDYLEIIVSGDKMVEGNISGMYEDIFEVNNQKYRMSKGLMERISESNTSNESEYTKIRMPELGGNIKLFVYGDIITGYIANNGYMYAYLKDIKQSRTSIDPDLTLRLYTQNGEWIDAPFADKVTIDTVPGYSKTDIYNWLEETYDESNKNKDVILDELVRVKLNGKNSIVALDTIIQVGEETETFDDICHASDYEGGRVTAKPGFHRWEIGQERYKFDKTAPLFVVPENRSKEDKYRAVNPTALGSVSYDMICYSPDEFLHLGAVVVIGDLEGASTSNRIDLMYIESMRDIIIDAENFEYGYRVMGTLFVESATPGVGSCKEVSYTITKERYDEAAEAGNAFVIGDVIRLDSVVKNEIIKWAFFNEIERGTSKITDSWNVYDYGTINGTEGCKVYVGKVKRIDAANVLLLLDCGDGGDIVLKPRAKAIIDVTAKKASNIEIGDLHENDIVFAFGVGAHAGAVYKTVNVE